jgi:hypothetical protein
VLNYVFIKGDQQEAAKLLELLGPDADAFARVDEVAFDRAGVEITPFALVLDRSLKVVAKGLVNDLQQLEGLIGEDNESERRVTEGAATA